MYYLNSIPQTFPVHRLCSSSTLTISTQYEKLIAAGSSHSASSISPSHIVKQIRLPPPDAHHIETSLAVRNAQQAIQTFKMLSAQKPHVKTPGCPMAHARDPEDLERDFTTPGVQGTLGCPFSKMANQDDPIAAEFHQDKNSTASPSTEQRPGQCPIRFLGNHSPEEIAKYVENHKHEIPRSHEICVRRYQQNESSARQLDAKYGSLANMIQGLGDKHKAYLPERDRTEEPEKDSSQAVEKWAENVSSDAAPVADVAVPADEEPRLSRFEMPLREVRVGESPSRPWGISVPADKQPSPSALQSEDGIPQTKPENSHAAADANQGKCPVDHKQGKAPDLPEAAPAGKDRPSVQIIFSGPVFFGYPADQLATLLQHTNLGGAKG